MTTSPPPTPSPTPRPVGYGETIGWFVVVWENGGYTEDWDGEVHRNFDAARGALRECSQAGYTCFLAQLTKVTSDDPLPSPHPFTNARGAPSHGGTH